MSRPPPSPPRLCDRAPARPDPASPQSPQSPHLQLIAWLRGAAAVEVAAAHLRARLYDSLTTVADPAWWFQALAFCTGYAHQAVVVFFLLSGWLVGGPLLERHHRPHALRRYALDRLTRLWIVLVPAFLAIIGLSLLDGTLAAVPDIDAGHACSWPSFIGNLFGLQNLLVPPFGADAPLWSLSNESAYYLMFPLMLMLHPARPRAARLGAALTLTLLVCTLPPALLLYFTLWLLGAAASRWRLRLSTPARAVLCLLTLAVSAGFRLRGHNNDLDTGAYRQDLLLSLLFLPLLASTMHEARRGRQTAGWLQRRLRAVGVRLASSSFTLYVLHQPLIDLLPRAGRALPLSPQRLPDLLLYGLLLSAIVLLSYVFHLPFEAQTHRLRAWLWRRLSGHAGATTADAPAWEPAAVNHRSGPQLPSSAFSCIDTPQDRSCWCAPRR